MLFYRHHYPAGRLSFNAPWKLSFSAPPIASSSFPIIVFDLRGSDGRASFWFERLDAGQHPYLQRLLVRDFPMLL